MGREMGVERPMSTRVSAIESFEPGLDAEVLAELEGGSVTPSWYKHGSLGL